MSEWAPQHEEVGSALPTGESRTTVTLAEFATWVAQARGRPRLLDRIVRQLKVAPTSVAPWARVETGRYTRTLVYRDEHVEVLVLAWAPGVSAAVHDHGGQRCWVQVAEGVLESTDFRRVRGGRRPGGAVLATVGERRRLGPGDVDARGRSGRLHGVRAPMQDGVAISVHVYARPITRCLVFDLRAQRCESRTLRYDYVGPKASRAIAADDADD